MLNHFFSWLIENIDRILTFLQIVVTLFLALFVPFKIQRFIGNRNLIKEQLRKELNTLEQLILAIQDKIDSGKIKKVGDYRKQILPLFKNAGFLIHFILEDLVGEIDFITKKFEGGHDELKKSILKKYISYRKTLINDLFTKNFKITNEYLQNCNDKKNALIKELKLFSYKIYDK